jgi:ribosomal protein L40E
MRPEVRGICSNCNAPNSYTSTSCSSCGARLPWADAASKAASVRAAQEAAPQQIAAREISARESAASRDKLSFAAGLQGFLSPLEGFILYFGLRGETPLRARSIALGAITSTVLVFIVLLVVGILFLNR